MKSKGNWKLAYADLFLGLSMIFFFLWIGEKLSPERKKDVIEYMESSSPYNIYQKEIIDIDVTNIKDVLPEGIELTKTNAGYKIRISEESKKLFSEGSSVLTKEGIETLYKIYSYIDHLPNKIRISAYTYENYQDDEWELSSERANICRKEFINNGIKSSRIHSIVSYGRNDSEDNKDKFNKIDILLIK